MKKISDPYQIIDTFFRIAEEAQIMEKNESIEKKPLTRSLEESVWQYIALVLILFSNFYNTGDWKTFWSLVIAFAVFIFSGWVKKMAELKIGELIAQTGLKDKEILKLKEIRAKLESEIKRLSEKLTDLSNSPPSPKIENTNP